MCCTTVYMCIIQGADCLSKWVGEAEKQLRLLFEQAKRNAPAVIFFDEIDGEFIEQLFM
jgi:SpoVK/Ycf46/Vps4 family AAA+-type ATPase